jgi:hypothetical protein
MFDQIYSLFGLTYNKSPCQIKDSFILSVDEGKVIVERLSRERDYRQIEFYTHEGLVYCSGHIVGQVNEDLILWFSDVIFLVHHLLQP